MSASRSDRILQIAACVLLPVAWSMAAEPGNGPWMNPVLDADQRARLLLREMTLDDRFTILHGRMAIPFMHFTRPEGAIGSAGYVRGRS